MIKLKEELSEANERPSDEENTEVSSIDFDTLEIYCDKFQNKINRVITLGGDGTVVQAIKLFCKDKCPSMITFSEESLGYLCCFESDNYEEVLYHSLIKGAQADLDTEEIEHKQEKDCLGKPYIETRERVVLKILFENEDKPVHSLFSPTKTKRPKFGSLYSLNQITIDRGSFNYLTNIECYLNGHMLTVIQGDGVIIATPTGSTAYNMSAGGSIVYNYVNSLLLTPI